MPVLDPENFAEFMDEELYGEQGFYTLGNGSGRTRDFLTSPEVGDLFGRVIARYIDQWYESLDTEQPAIVVDAGCGPGSLAASIARSHMHNAQMIDYFLVDRSAVHLETAEKKLETINTSFSWSTYEKIPECEFPTLIIANELLDNLVFNIAYTHDLYKQFEPDRVAVPEAAAYFGIFGNIDNATAASVPADIANFRVPVHIGIMEWLDEVLEATGQVTNLRLLLFDYMTNVVDMKDENWLRVYANNKRIVGVDNVLEALNSGVKGDITTDINFEDLLLLLDKFGFSRITNSYQANWLEEYGAQDFLNSSNFQSGYDRALEFAVGTSESKSEVGFAVELDLLCDPNGLGAFKVVEARREI